MRRRRRQRQRRQQWRRRQAGGSITISETSQPDFLDPALTYTVNGIEPLWIVYTPLLTYKHAEGHGRHRADPGRGRGPAEISKDGKTYELTLRKGLKYSDGSPVKASDWEHSLKRVLNLESGGSAFFYPIVGAQEYVKKGDPNADIPGVTTDDKTGKITIKLTEPDGSFQNVLAMWFAGDRPGDTPFKNLTKDPPPGVGAYKVTESVPNRQFVLEKNKFFNLPGIPKGNLDKITVKIVKNAQRQAEDVISGTLDYMQDPPPADIKPEVKAKYSRSLPGASDLVDLLHVHEHARGSVRQEGGPRGGEHRPRQAGPRTAVRRRGGSRAARSCRRACRATTRRST